MEDNQEAAKEKSAIPDQVIAAEPPVAELQAYQQQNEQAKGTLSKYGHQEVEQFVAALNNNPVFARAVVKDMLSVEAYKPATIGNVAGSPQEHNITGVLDHSEYPPKLKQAQDASVPDAKPETVV